MDPILSKFLEQFKIKDEIGTPTHVSLSPPGRYHIRDDGYEGFMKAVCETVAGGGYHSLAEIPSTRMTLVIPIRLLYDSTDKTYTPEFVKGLTRTTQNVIFDLLNIDQSAPIQACCFLLEQESSDGIDYLKSGSNYYYRFQLHFPYCRMETAFLKEKFLPELMKRYKDDNLVSYLKQGPQNDWSDIFDQDFFNRPILMYGGTRLKDEPKLYLTGYFGVYKNHLPELISGDQETEYIYLDQFDAIHTCVVRADFFTSNPDIRYWLPVFFSQKFYREITVKKNEEVNDNFRFVPNDDDAVTGDTRRNNDLESYFDVAKLINPQRFQNLRCWIDVGAGLFHCTRGSRRGYIAWTTLTEDFYDMDPAICEDYWEKFHEQGTNNITEQTIAYYAMLDNKEAYKEWHDARVIEKLDEASSGTDDDIIIAFKEKYPYHFLYDRSQWYRFEDHRWVVDPEGFTIINSLATDFISIIRDHINRLNDRAGVVPAPNRDIIDRKVKALVALLSKLKGGPFKTRLLNCMKRLYVKSNFNSIKDESRHLTVCKNGVIEVSVDRRSIFFRPGKPEDYCTKSTKMMFPTENGAVIPRDRAPQKLLKKLETIDRYFTQLFIDPKNPEDTSFKNWNRLHRASFLHGGNDLKNFVIFHGPKNSSKSQYEKFILSALGEYAIKGPNSMITFGAKENIGGATPELTRTQGTRVVFIDELDSRTPLDAGKIRKRTGGDSEYTRDLYEGSGTIIDLSQQYRLMATMNKYAPINDPSVDAFWERVNLVTFLVRYLDARKVPTDPHERWMKRIYPMDRAFEESIISLAPAMLWMMFHDYSEYARNGLPQCDFIDSETMKYRSSSDFYINFVKSALRENRENTVSTTRMYQHFKNWYNRKFPNSRPPNEPQLQQELANKGIFVTGNNYNGYELATEILNHEEPETDENPAG
jgi:hypothetical protein